VLQSLDISQLDWYAGQIMVVPPHFSSLLSTYSYFHAVLIDFSACGLTIPAYNRHGCGDYGAVQDILVDSEEGVGLRKDLARNWFGEILLCDLLIIIHERIQNCMYVRF
jgi:hypothetical protein